MGNMGIIPAVGYESSVVQTFSSPTGTSHTMTYAAGVNDMVLVINNVIQEPTVAYTTSGTTLTTGTLVSGDTMYIIFLALTRQTVAPGADTVTSAMIVDNAIDSEHYTDASIDLAHMSVNSIDSAQYVDGSIDTAHIATNQIDETLLKDALVGDFSDVTVTAADTFLYGDATDSGNTKKDTIQGILDLAGGGLTSQVIESTYDQATASGTVDYTGAGFDPTAALIISAQGATSEMSFGWVDSDNDNSALVDYHGVGADQWAGASGHAIQMYASASNNVLGVATLISDGIRLTYTKVGSPTGTNQIYIFCMK